MRLKTSELTGPALDWAVWTAAGGAAAYPKTASGKAFLKLWKGNSAKYIHPSTDWAQGGPIIDREDIDVLRDTETEFGARLGHMEKHPQRDVMWWCGQRGPTKLIAAMRCYVASRLGDEVDVPEELT